MGLGNRNAKSGDQGSNYKVDLKTLEGLQKLVDSNPTGTWQYVSASLPVSGTVSSIGKTMSIRVFAVAVDSKFTVNGGATINVRANTGVDLFLNGQVTNSKVEWVSGYIDVIITSLV